MTGSQVLAVGGIVSAALSSIGGLLLMPRVIGLAGGVMLIANVVALLVERHRVGAKPAALANGRLVPARGESPSFRSGERIKRLGV